jgi:hypothetical protein
MVTEARNEVNRVLLKCNSMQSLEKRRRVVQDLPDEIKFGIAEDNTPNVHISNIIDRCADFPGGLRNLLERLEQYEGGTRALHKAAPLVLGLELLKIIEDEDGIGEAELSSFFSKSLPRFQPLRQASNAWEQIKLLWQMHLLANHRSPILRYVDQIIERSTWSEAELRAWQTWALGRTFLGLQEGSGPIQNKQGSLITPYLTILVKPSSSPEGDNYSAYEISTYLWLAPIDKCPLETEGKIEHLAKLPEVVANAVNEAEGHLLRHRTQKLIIEFCLPHNLLFADIDRLPWPKDKDKINLGLYYPIVIRSLDRLMTQSQHNGRTLNRWKERWEQFQEIVGQVKDLHEMKTWLCSVTNQTHLEMRRRLLDDTKDLCYLGIYYTAEHRQDAERLVLEVILSEGVPVILYPRIHPSVDESQVQQFLNAIFCSGQIGELPHQLKQRRHEVYNQDNHPANHMTLVWDDFDRIPPLVPGGARSFTSAGL